MTIRTLILPILLSFTLTASPLALASDVNHDSLQEMAEILLKLNHYPSASEKEELKAIKNNNAASEHIRSLAQALINLKHSASDADKPALKAIMDDSSASRNVREMAGIIYNLNHKPSASDKEKLRAMK